MEVIQAAIEILTLNEKRKLLHNNPSSIRSAVNVVKKDDLDDDFLKEAKKGTKRIVFSKCAKNSFLQIYNFFQKKK